MDNNILIELHKLVRKDPYVSSITAAIESELVKLNESIADIDNQMWFDSATWYLNSLSNELNIELDSNLSIEEKRSIIEARWKSSGKSDIYLLQAVADSWKNGEINVSFSDGIIQIKFNSIFGVPSNLDNLKIELEKNIPAHLPIVYILNYLLIEDIQAMTLEELEQQTLDKFAF